MYADISRFGYGGDVSSVGGAMTPSVAGISGFGASDPTAAYLSGSFPSAPSAPSTGFTDMVGRPGSGPGGFGSTGLGWNVGTAQLALGGLQTIGNLWQAWEANKLAKETFKFQKDFANTNLTNQIQSYNTALEDRSFARAHTEGRSTADAQAYIDQHSLRKRTV